MPSPGLLPAALIPRWLGLCARLSGRDSAPCARVLLTRLEAVYTTPPRAYHTLDHACDCVCAFDHFSSLAADADLVEWALWLHDSVYVAGSPDNEAKSAAISGEFLDLLGAAPGAAERAHELIMATRHTGEPLSGDAALIADVDMSILAAEAEVYTRYTAGIRLEYAFASEDRYRSGRAAFLRSLLARPAIYFTSELRARFEAPARVNIQNELHALGLPK